MITIIILAFVGMFAIAGTFVSIEANRRSGREKSDSGSNGRPSPDSMNPDDNQT